MNRKILPIAIAAAVALAGCSRGGDPTPEQAARNDYTRIVAGADAVMFADVLGYRPGAPEPERVSTTCTTARCAIGFGRPFGTSSFSAETVDLEVRPARNGVRQVVERSSSDSSDVTVFGGWMEHSFFGSQANLIEADDNPNKGATVLYSYALGSGTAGNPSAEGGATWSGFVVGRDAGVAGNLESVVTGDALVSVRLGNPALQADVEFTGLANTETGTSYPDMAWRGMPVSEGSFGQDNGDGALQGRFFGPEQEEVAGVFERNRIVGAFGATRE